MRGFRKKNAKNLHFWAFCTKMAILDSFWPKWAKREFFQKVHGTFFSRLQALTNCKVSEKSNEQFPRKALRTNGRMNEWTYGHDS